MDQFLFLRPVPASESVIEVSRRPKGSSFTLMIGARVPNGRFRNIGSYDGAGFAFHDPSNPGGVRDPMTDAEALCGLSFHHLEFRKAASLTGLPFWQDLLDEIRKTHTVSAVIDS